MNSRLSWLEIVTWTAFVSVVYGLGCFIGYRIGTGEVRAAWSSEQQQLAEQQRQASAEQLRHYQQLALRASHAEQQLQDVLGELEQSRQQLNEKINHVTTVYRPAPAAEPVRIPHCVFTVGWLRQYNAALGAVSTSGATPATGNAQEATSATSGTDTELLESGVTPADILAHARDYGLWARGNAAQLNALLDLRGED